MLTEYLAEKTVPCSVPTHIFLCTGKSNDLALLVLALTRTAVLLHGGCSPPPNPKQEYTI